MMKKNSRIVIRIESEILNKLKQEAIEQEIQLSELCRQKISQNHPLNKIEMRLKRIEESIASKVSKTSRQSL